jgi:putative glycosyltransferase (TIGR04348 family)
MIGPIPAGSRGGNRVSAVRWARMLRREGHRVLVAVEYTGQPCDLVIALHARRSYESIAAYRAAHPVRPLIVVLTGTDLYRDLKSSAQARDSLELASHLVVLNPLGAERVPARFRHKVRPIVQSAETRIRPVAQPRRWFDICVVGHLRSEKDPFRAALAARKLPRESRIRIRQAGGALSPAMEKQARREELLNPRYRWLGDLPRWRVWRLMANSRALALPSRMEGGANVISEAVAMGLPILSSRIHSSVALLGDDYPGYHSAGDTAALRELFMLAEHDDGFLGELADHIQRLAPRFAPEKEQRAWAQLVEEAIRSG